MAPSEPDGTSRRALQVRLPDDLHRELKAIAISHGRSFNDLITRALRDFAEVQHFSERLNRHRSQSGKVYLFALRPVEPIAQALRFHVLVAQESLDESSQLLREFVNWEVSVSLPVVIIHQERAMEAALLLCEKAVRMAIDDLHGEPPERGRQIVVSIKNAGIVRSYGEGAPPRFQSEPYLRNAHEQLTQLGQRFEEVRTERELEQVMGEAAAIIEESVAARRRDPDPSAGITRAFQELRGQVLSLYNRGVERLNALHAIADPFFSDRASEWTGFPQPELGGRTPVEASASEAGMNALRELVTRHAYGLPG